MKDHLAARAKAARMSAKQLAEITSQAGPIEKRSPLELAAQDEIDQRTSQDRTRSPN